MAGIELPFAEGRHGGELQRWLRNEIAGIAEDLFAELGPLLCIGGWADQHAVTTGFRHRLHHQLLQLVEHKGAI